MNAMPQCSPTRSLSSSDHDPLICNASNINWVMDMFPAAFPLHVCKADVTTEEIRKVGNGSVQLCEHLDGDDIFVRLASKSVSSIDIAAIKNVFQRVWIMMQAYREAEENSTTQTMQEATSKLPQPNISEPTGECINATDVTPFIWDTSEINVLRKELRSLNDENAKLRGRLSVLESDSLKLANRDKRQQECLIQVSKQLKDAVGANNRLRMLVEHMKNELDVSTKVVRQMHIVASDKNKLLYEKNRLECELLGERSKFRQFSSSMEAKMVAQLENRQLGEAVVQDGHMKESAKLLEKIEELSQQLAKERLDHSRTKIGLQHMRIHFANLSNIGDTHSMSHCRSLSELSFQ